MNAVVPLQYLAQMPVEKAREEGYVCLTPLQRAVAIEFATTGGTLAQVAKNLEQPLFEVRKAFNDPIVRALIHDIQNEITQHKIVNAAWVEQQVLTLWPKLIGEEAVSLVNKSGEQISAKKFHGPEVASIIKHFSGNGDQKKTGGVQVIINFGDMGVSQTPRPQIVIEAEDVSQD